MKKIKSPKSSMTKFLPSSFFCLSILIACSPIQVHNIAEARKAVGHQIIFQGKAQNAKLGAAVIGDEFGLTCINPDSWPESQVGKEVQVTGVLELTDDFKYAKAPDGSISQGTEGQDYLIQKCVVK